MRSKTHIPFLLVELSCAAAALAGLFVMAANGVEGEGAAIGLLVAGVGGAGLIFTRWVHVEVEPH